LLVTACAIPSVARWNIAAYAALIVVMEDALFDRFLGFFGGVVLRDFAVGQLY